MFSGILCMVCLVVPAYFLLCMYVWHIVPVSVSWRTANANKKHAAHV